MRWVGFGDGGLFHLAPFGVTRASQIMSVRHLYLQSGDSGCILVDIKGRKDKMQQLLIESESKSRLRSNFSPQLLPFTSAIVQVVEGEGHRLEVTGR